MGGRGPDTESGPLLTPSPRLTGPLPDPADGGRPASPGHVWTGVVIHLLLTVSVLELPRAFAARYFRRRERTERNTPAAVGAGLNASRAPAEVAVPAHTTALHGAPVEPAGGAPGGPVAPEGDGARDTDGPPMGRRLLLGRTVGAVAGVTALGTVGHGMSVALGAPLTHRVPIALTELDPRMAGLRIAVVSDIHLGPLLGRSHTERIVRLINRQEPDVVAVVGDLADGTAAQLGPAARPLRNLESRYGNFFVTGNHEYLYDGVEDWLDEMRDVGIRPLVNERVEIWHNGAVLDLAGVEDVTGEEVGRGPDFDRALGGRDTSRPVVLLAHQPVLAEEAARHGVDLQLSGHTHGGQMVPLNLVNELSNPVVSGLGRVDDTWLYVTRGAGFFGPPVRVGAPPDITMVELGS